MCLDSPQLLDRGVAAALIEAIEGVRSGGPRHHPHRDFSDVRVQGSVG